MAVVSLYILHHKIIIAYKDDYKSQPKSFDVIVFKVHPEKEINAFQQSTDIAAFMTDTKIKFPNAVSFPVLISLLNEL